MLRALPAVEAAWFAARDAADKDAGVSKTGDEEDGEAWIDLGGGGGGGGGGAMVAIMGAVVVPPSAGGGGGGGGVGVDTGDEVYVAK